MNREGVKGDTVNGRDGQDSSARSNRLAPPYYGALYYGALYYGAVLRVTLITVHTLRYIWL